MDNEAISKLVALYKEVVNLEKAGHDLRGRAVSPGVQQVLDQRESLILTMSNPDVNAALTQYRTWYRETCPRR